MKILLIFLIVFNMADTTAAQPPKRYDTCAYLKQYEGEWMSANGSDTVRLYLRYHKYYNSYNRVVISRLIGWHEYKQGSTIVESDYDRRFAPLAYNWLADTTKASVILDLNFCNASWLILSGVIADLNQANELKPVEATLNAAKNQITWVQKHGEGVGMVTGAHGMTLPSTFTLVRQ